MGTPGRHKKEAVLKKRTRFSYRQIVRKIKQGQDIIPDLLGSRGHPNHKSTHPKDNSLQKKSHGRKQ